MMGLPSIKSGGVCMYKKILPLLLVCIMLSGCSGGYKDTEDAVQKTLGNEVETLCTEQLKPGTRIVFYRDMKNNEFGCGLERKIFGRWYWDNGNSGTKKITEDERGMVWASQNFKNIILGTIPVVYGITLDKRISRVTVTLQDKKTIEADVINTKSGITVWYAAGKGVGNPQVIKGIAQNSQLLYYYPPRK